MCTSIYLINRLPTSNLQNKSPFHLAYNQEPNYNLLKSFGCTCYPCLRPYTTSKLDSRSERCIFLGYSVFHHGYRCISLTSGKLYISSDVIFLEHIYPYKELSSINNPDTQHTLGLLGSSPTTIGSTHITQFLPQSTNPSLVTSTSSERSHSSPTSSPSLHEQDQSSLVSSEPHNSHHSAFSLSPDNNSSKLSTKGHIPSIDPISPSNLDSHNSNSHVKTRRLSDILRTIDSVNATGSTKFPIPTCLHVSSSIPSEPVNFSFAIKQPEWIGAMKDKYDALIHNKTWQFVTRLHNRPVIGCKWIYKTKPSPDGTSHKYKAHLVAKGFLQGRINYHENFSPIIKVTTIWLLLALVISQNDIYDI